MLIVDTPEKLSLVLEFINGTEILAFDIETTGLDVFKDKVIGFGVSNGLASLYVPILEWNGKSVVQASGTHLYSPILAALSSRKLLMHNGSFDTRFVKNDLGVDLLPSLYCDTMLLKHTCDEEFPFGLKEIAAALWGQDVKEEKLAMQSSIKANGGKPTEYYKADLSLIATYCMQDCQLTYRIYNHYNPILKREGLTKFFYEDEVMPLYKEVTIPMEEVGIRLDTPRMESALHAINKDLFTLEQCIQAAIAPSLNIFTTWFLNKDYPLQTPKGKAPMWMRKHDRQIDAWKADNPEGYMFNLLSKHHLKKVFFDTLHEQPLNTTPTGLPQVDEEFLDSVASKYEWVPQLIQFNKLTKIKSTYIERFLNEQTDGRFYASFYQHRTVSGRYGSDLQQLPRPVEGNDIVANHTSSIRQFFLADAGCKLVAADYNSLEPRIFSHVSEDPALIAIFNEGKDFYSEIAIRTERLAGVSSIKTADNYLGKVNKAARQKAKAYSLGIPYGLTGYKLQFEIGVTNEQADQLVKDYLAAFPKLATWMDTSVDEARTNGYIKSQAGRVRHLRRIPELFGKYGAVIGNSLELWKHYHNDTSLYAVARACHKEYKNLCNNARNFQIQSLAASVVNQSMISIARQIKAAGLEAKIVNSVHDEIVMNVPISELAQVKQIMQQTMENIVKLALPLPAEPVVGDNYAECK